MKVNNEKRSSTLVNSMFYYKKLEVIGLNKS